MTDELMDKHILITGAAGYLGSNMIEMLKDLKCHLVCLDSKKDFLITEKSVAKIDCHVLDIRSQETWEKVLPGIDIIFHFAAQTSVYVANQEPAKDMEINVLPMLTLLEACRKNSYCPTVVFSGSVTETGIPARLPVDESHPDLPVTIYDLHKLMAEKYLQYYAGQFVVKGAVLRLANVYGPGPKSSSPDRGILNKMIKQALEGKDLTLYGKGDFLRDYIYIGDVILAFLSAAVHIDAINGGHFVISTGQGHTLAKAFDLVTERVALRTGQRVKVLNVEPPETLSPIENRNFVGDSSRFSKATGWQPNLSLVQGMDLTIDHFTNR